MAPASISRCKFGIARESRSGVDDLPVRSVPPDKQQPVTGSRG